MPDAPNGQGQNAGSPEPTATPGVPAVPPADDAGQGGGGQDAGQGAGDQHHDLNPEVTRAQQAAAEARREAEALRTRLAEMEGAGRQAPDEGQPDPDAEVFDRFASKSKVIQQQAAIAQNTQAQLMDTQMRVRQTEFPHYDAVRDKVAADLRQMGHIPVERMDQAMQMVYARHAHPIVNARDTALARENAELKARIEAITTRAQSSGIDVGALHAQGSAGTDMGGGPPQEPAPDAPANEWGQYVDAMNAWNSRRR